MKLITILLLLTTTSINAQEITPEEFKKRGHYGTELEMKCKVSGASFTRCENSEVVCYKIFNGGTQCKFK